MGYIPETTAEAVRATLLLPFVIMGLSHIVQPGLWRDFFMRLHAFGPPAIIVRTFMLELLPASLIVALHQVWSGTAMIVTIYGHLLLVKIAVSQVIPAFGMRSLSMAEKYGKFGFRFAGLVLMGLGIICATGLSI